MLTGPHGQLDAKVKKAFSMFDSPVPTPVEPSVATAVELVNKVEPKVKIEPEQELSYRYSMKEMLQMEVRPHINDDKLIKCIEFNERYNLPHPKVLSEKTSIKTTPPKEVLVIKDNYEHKFVNKSLTTEENKPRVSPAWGTLNPNPNVPQGSLYQLNEKKNGVSPSCAICGGAHANVDCGWIKRLGA